MGFFRTQSIWKRGERAAEKHLRKHGFKILSRNLRLPIGEIDLLCLERTSNTIVIVEVKARKVHPDDRVQVDPTANIGVKKQHKLRSLALLIKKDPRFSDHPIRIDAIGVIFKDEQRKPIELKHYISAVKG